MEKNSRCGHLRGITHTKVKSYVFVYEPTIFEKGSKKKEKLEFLRKSEILWFAVEKKSVHVWWRSSEYLRRYPQVTAVVVHFEVRRKH